MKIVYENDDEVVYEGERCIVKGPVKQFNGMDGVHIVKPNGDIVLVPVAVVQAYNDWLLEKCVELLNAYEQWEANLTTDDDDEVLEAMSTENYDMMIRLQSMRSDIGRALSARNKRKN